MFRNSSRDLFTLATAMVWLQNLYDAYLGQDESHVNLLLFVHEGVTTCGALLVLLATMQPLLYPELIRSYLE